MDNYTAIAYGCFALRQLQKEGTDINEDTLKGRMLYLMDIHSENEIYRIYEKFKKEE